MLQDKKTLSALLLSYIELFLIIYSIIGNRIICRKANLLTIGDSEIPILMKKKILTFENCISDSFVGATGF